MTGVTKDSHCWGGSFAHAVQAAVAASISEWPVASPDLLLLLVNERCQSEIVLR